MSRSLINRDIVAMVIAGGYSERMGEFKPVLEIGEKTAIVHLIDNICSAGITKIYIVTGHEAKKIKDEISKYRRSKDKIMKQLIKAVHNENYDEGMFSSIKSGLRELSKSEDVKGVLLFPVDIPLVSLDTIWGVIQEYKRYDMPAKFCMPRVGEKNGHPLLIPREYFEEILEYEGDGGLKAIRRKYDDDSLFFNTDDEGALLDMDSPEDYKRLVEYYESK